MPELDWRRGSRRGDRLCRDTGRHESGYGSSEDQGHLRQSRGMGATSESYVGNKYPASADQSVQFTVPLNHAMMKEITIKQSFAYDPQDFRAVVDDFVELRIIILVVG